MTTTKLVFMFHINSRLNDENLSSSFKKTRPLVLCNKDIILDSDGDKFRNQ